MNRLKWNLTAFLIMYLIATGMGFATYELLGPVAMWIAVFVVMPVIAALLIYWFLVKIKCSPDRTLREMLVLTVIWIALSFSFDAITYVLVVPALSHASAHWTFFVDQSPWIWISYAVLNHFRVCRAMVVPKTALAVRVKPTALRSMTLRISLSQGSLATSGCPLSN